MLLMVSDSKSMTLFIGLSLSPAPVVLKIITIERFHSRDQHLRKFIGTKESICIRKEFNSHRIDLGHQYGRRDIMWKCSITITLQFTEYIYNASRKSTCLVNSEILSEK